MLAGVRKADDTGGKRRRTPTPSPHRQRFARHHRTPRRATERLPEVGCVSACGCGGARVCDGADLAWRPLAVDITGDLAPLVGTHAEIAPIPRVSRSAVANRSRSTIT